MIFLVFKGVDLHSGYAPSESPEAHQAWVDSELSPAWNRAGPQNRLGFVCYPARAATQRNAAMNMTPAQKFGNFASAQPHKTRQSDFATDGVISLGGQDAWANRLGREIIYGMWNQLQQCNLDFDIDLDVILQAISYKNQEDKVTSLKPLPYNPIRDGTKLKLWRGYYAWYYQQCASMDMGIQKWIFVDKRQQQTNIDRKELEDKLWGLDEHRQIITQRTGDAALIKKTVSALMEVDALKNGSVESNEAK